MSHSKPFSFADIYLWLMCPHFTASFHLLSKLLFNVSDHSLYPTLYTNALNTVHRSRKEYAATLKLQVDGIRRRKAQEAASMNEVEERLNKLAMKEAGDYFRRNPLPPPRSVEIKTQPW